MRLHLQTDGVHDETSGERDVEAGKGTEYLFSDPDVVGVTVELTGNRLYFYTRVEQ